MDRRVIGIILVILLCTSAAWGRMGVMVVGGTPASGSCTYTAVDSFTQAGTANLTLGSTVNSVRVAGSYDAATSYTLKRFSVPMTNVGDVSGLIVTPYIYSDSFNSPGSVLAIGTAVSGSNISGEGAFQDFDFASGVSIFSGTRYWYALHVANRTSSNYFRVLYTNPGNSVDTLLMSTETISWTTYDSTAQTRIIGYSCE